MRAFSFSFAPIVLCAVLALAGCRPSEPEPPAVARVGDRVITAEEFVLNYAFGHGHLRRGPAPRRTYLTLMLREAALAREAERRGLDTSAAVVHALHTLREELLIERVFETHVLDRIEVSEEEIRAEIHKNAVRFRFRFLPALHEADAWRLREQILAQGYEAALAERQERFAELNWLAEELTSDYVRAEDIDPAVLAVLQDLEIGTPSEPVRLDDLWYVFEVTDIRRRPVGEPDYVEQAPTYRKILYNRKAMEQGRAFVAATMAPRNVTTRREGFEVLHAALWAWYRDAPPTRNLLHYIETQRLDTPYTRLLRDRYALPLVSFDDQTWTIRDFLAHFTPGRYLLRPRDERAFKARLADVVALVVRDHVFLQMAEDEDLGNDPAFQQELARWREKWLFQELRTTWLNEPLDTARLAAYYHAKEAALDTAFRPFEHLDAEDLARIRTRFVQERLARLADSLLAGLDVEIYEAVLDTLSIPESAKNPAMTVHLFKNNSNKQPFPIVDPLWR
ncbi:hypothetical protein AWN76_014445 [Rhodothermaceae bacterium RA]|nr:hypothetical protein AWN76_014445 [Rhodothermaceae bacterium RA]